MIKFLSELKQDLANETVLLRTDFNVETVGESWKLHASLPTIQWLHERGAKIIVMSHCGRPIIPESAKKISDATFSLEKLVSPLSNLLHTSVGFLRSGDIEELKKYISRASAKSIILLENLRFLKEEIDNNSNFARRLASMGTIYVNDAFAVSHRTNASLVAITKYIPSYAGLLFEKEYTALRNVMKKPKHPLVFILGGAKTEEKMGIIKHFLRKADVFLVGGVVANTILKAKGVDIGSSLSDESQAHFAVDLAKNEKVIVPEDFIMHDGKIFDIGPKTIKIFLNYIKKAKMIVWSGPLGKVEDPHFTEGTLKILNALTKSKAYTITGGGDTTQFIFIHGLQDKLSLTSTGGGAMLEFLAGNKLPGVEALK